MLINKFINIPRQKPIFSLSVFWLVAASALTISAIFFSSYTGLIYQLVVLSIMTKIIYDKHPSNEIFSFGVQHNFKFTNSSQQITNDNSSFPGVGQRLGSKPTLWEDIKAFIHKQVNNIKPYLTNYKPLKVRYERDNQAKSKLYLNIGFIPFGASVTVIPSKISLQLRCFFGLNMQLTYPQLSILLSISLILIGSPIFLIPLSMIMSSGLTNMPYIALHNFIAKKPEYSFARTLVFLPQLIISRYFIPSMFTFLPSNLIIAASILIIDSAEKLQKSNPRNEKGHTLRPHHPVTTRTY